LADKAGLAERKCLCQHQLTLPISFGTFQGIVAVEKFKYLGIFIFEPPL
jgi:hypothetical protein